MRRRARNVVRRGRSALRRDNRRLLAEMIRYGMVAALAFAVDYGSLVIFGEVFRLHYLVAASLAFTLGIITNYAISRFWVFNATPHNKGTELGLFLGVGVTGLLLNALIMWIATGLLGVHYLISKLISTAIVFFWNFLLRRFLIYTGPRAVRGRDRRHRARGRPAPVPGDLPVGGADPPLAEQVAMLNRAVFEDTPMPSAGEHPPPSQAPPRQSPPRAEGESPPASPGPADA